MPQQFDSTRQSAAPQAGDEQLHAATAARALDAGDVLDSVLDDIESVLQTNAEEYVSSFVQKGGE